MAMVPVTVDASEYQSLSKFFASLRESEDDAANLFVRPRLFDPVLEFQDADKTSIEDFYRRIYDYVTVNSPARPILPVDRCPWQLDAKNYPTGVVRVVSESGSDGYRSVWMRLSTPRKGPDNLDIYPVLSASWYWMHTPAMCGMAYLHNLGISSRSNHPNIYDTMVSGSDLREKFCQSILKCLKQTANAWGYSGIMGTDYVGGQIWTLFSKDESFSHTDRLHNRNSKHDVAAVTIKVD